MIDGTLKSLYRNFKSACFNAKLDFLESLHLHDSGWYPGTVVLTPGKVEQLRRHSGTFGFECLCGCQFICPVRQVTFRVVLQPANGMILYHLHSSHSCPECGTEVICTLGDIGSLDPHNPPQLQKVAPY
jgi:hypothetical protein